MSRLVVGQPMDLKGLTVANEYFIGKNSTGIIIIAAQDGKSLCGMPMSDRELRDFIASLEQALRFR